MFRLCCWRVPNTNEMSIKPVRAARITDTTGALLGESRGRRRPRNAVKNDVFEHPAQDTYKSVDRIRAGVGRGSTGGRAGVYRGSNKRVGGRGGERKKPSVTNRWGLGVEPCSRPVVSMFATVRNRSQPSATVCRCPQ